MNPYRNNASETSSAPTRHIGRLLHELANDFQQRTLAKCKQRGHGKIRGAHSAILGHMNTTGLCLTELAHRVGISQQATGKLIKDLERNGYANSHTDARDKRSRIISLSERGVALIRDIEEILEEVRQEYRAALGDEAMRTFEHQLQSTARLINRAP